MSPEAIQKWEQNEGVRVEQEDQQRAEARQWVRNLEVSLIGVLKLFTH